MQSSSKTEVTISTDLLAALEAIPDKRAEAAKEFTPEMDAAILQFYASKPKKPLAKALGIGTERLKERYTLLTGGNDARDGN